MQFKAVFCHIAIGTRVYKYGFCSEVLHVETLVSNSDKRLFRKMSNQAHCLHLSLIHI